MSAGRLSKKIGRRFGLGRVSAGRAMAIQSVIPENLITTSSFGEFVWPPDLDPATWREFQTVDNDRPIQEISPEELVNAMVSIAASSGSVERKELGRETARIFGIRRFTGGIAEHLDLVVDAAIDADRLMESDGRLTALP